MKIYDKIISAIFAVTATFTLICYGSYFLKLFIYSEGMLPVIISVFVIAAILLPIIFREKLKQILKKYYIVFKTIYTAGLLFYTVTFLSMCGYLYFMISHEEQPAQLPEDSVVVVFGAKVYDDGPGVTLKRRLDRAADILHAQPDSVCVVSGGKGENEPRAEADIMCEYLISCGISEDRIYVEPESSNTVENIHFSAALIEGSELSERPVIALSSDFHIPRIKLLSERNDFADIYIHAKSASPFFLFTMLVREYMSYIKLFILYL